jgi:hypothetical protein
VIFVEPNSTILGPSGLKVGDVITSVNGCGVKDSQQWHHCLSIADHVRKELLYPIGKVNIGEEWELIKNAPLLLASILWEN